MIQCTMFHMENNKNDISSVVIVGDKKIIVTGFIHRSIFIEDMGKNRVLKIILTLQQRMHDYAPKLLQKSQKTSKTITTM